MTPRQPPAPSRCRACARRTAILVIIANVALGLFKLFVGAVAASFAVAIDGVQSLACALVGGFIAIGMKISWRPRDERFPLGYGKVENLVSFLANAGLFGLGLVMLASSLYLLWTGRARPPELIALPVAVISVMGNYLLSTLCQCAGVATQSPGLLANATQNRADMVSSTAVTASVALSLLGPGFYFFDALGAAVAALFIIYDSANNWWRDLSVLLEHELPAPLRQRIGLLALEVAGVEEVRFVRGRRVGRATAIELGVGVRRSLSLGALQRVSADLRCRLIYRLASVQEVRVFPFLASDAGDVRPEGPLPAAGTERSLAGT